MKLTHSTFIINLILNFSVVLSSSNIVSSKFVRSPSNCKNDKNVKNDKNDKNVPLLIVVHTAPANVERRNVLRETWTRNDPDFKTVFVIGHSLNVTLNDEVVSEIVKQNDILVNMF